MSFDDIIDRRGTHSSKWDKMQGLYGVSPDTGIPMWVADMDFQSPECVRRVVQEQADHGIYGYFGNDSDYLASIQWWMQTRHGWTVEPESIFTTAGLINAVAICLDTFTAPGDGVVLFTPVYHAFSRIIRTAGREVVECNLTLEDGMYAMDFDAYDAQMTGREKMVILCSPHNPGGRVWTAEELRGVAEFAKRHDLILISDEVHGDLVFNGHKHLPMPVAVPDVTDRLIMLTASSKTFNIAGLHVGNTIIPDPTLRAKFAARMAALGIAVNSIGTLMVTAAYSPEGAAWVDELVTYIEGNDAIFREGISAIPGVSVMPMQSTYLSWVDFAGTGMEHEEIIRRVCKEAQIAANYGPTFGSGGESYLRFNLGTQRSVIQDSVARMQKAFGDLQ
jgi:cystathionine beta-lyase